MKTFLKISVQLALWGLLDAGAQSLPQADPVQPQLNTVAAPAMPDAGTATRYPGPMTAPPLKDNVKLPQPGALAPAFTQSKDTTPIEIKGINIVGATQFPVDVLHALVSSVASGSHTLGELQAAANRITLHYRSAGFFLARAYLPAQKMDEGQVTIAVQEGRLAEVRVQNTSGLTDKIIKSPLGAMVPGTVMQRALVERALLLLGDVPGVGSVDSRLSPGTNTGETVLIATVKPVASWGGRLDVDNFGSLYTGTARVGASIEGNSPWGFGERVSANVLASGENMVHGRLALQIPAGDNGMTVGAGLSHTQYSLADTFKSLDAVGQSDALEANLRFPVVRSVQANLYAQAGFERRMLRDEVRSTGTLTDKDASVLSLALHADWRDSFGGLNANNQASVTVTSGRLHISSASVAAIDAAAAKTAGDYVKVAVSAARQQALSKQWSMYGQFRAQWANKNLDSSEKFSLGGPDALRAYPSGEASGDKGGVINFELRYAVLDNVAASLFYDAGFIHVNANPYLTTSNKRSLAGSGIGLSGNYDAFDWRMTVAWRDGAPSVSEPDRSPRVWTQAGWRF